MSVNEDNDKIYQKGESKNKETVVSRNLYRKLCEAPTSTESPNFGGLPYSDERTDCDRPATATNTSISIRTDNTPSSVSITDKINTNRKERSATAKLRDTGGGATYRANPKQTVATALPPHTSEEFRQSLYEDAFNQASASPIYSQLLKAISTNNKSVLLGRLEERVFKKSKEDTGANTNYKPPVRSSPSHQIRPRSSRSSVETKGRKVEDQIPNFQGKIYNRFHQSVKEKSFYKSSHDSSVISGSIQEFDGNSEHTNADGKSDSGYCGIGASNRERRAHFYIDDDENVDDGNDNEKINSDLVLEDEIANYTINGGFRLNSNNYDSDGIKTEHFVNDSVTPYGLHNQIKRKGVPFRIPNEDWTSNQFVFQKQLSDQDLTRRMSAPELPPIADTNPKPSKLKGDKRKTSTNSVGSTGMTYVL